MKDIAVEFRNISVQFPGVLANDDVSMTIKKGEIFALVGENGAGKTTLMKVLYGMHHPSAGHVEIFGKHVEKYDPSYAIGCGVGMVHQHFMLVPSFTVAQNIVLSKEPKKFGIFYDQKKAIEITKELIKTYGLEVDPNARIDQISVGAQQRVEILKTLYRGADILILDEPTAVLTPNEANELFAILRKIVAERGITVIIITHKLNEVMEVSDRVGVMRSGRLIGIRNTADVSPRILASMMIGRDVLLSDVERNTELGEMYIEVSNLRVKDDRGIEALRGVSFNVRSGEILGVAGVDGNGQSELAEAITGMREIADGTVTICGKKINGLTPGQVRELGLSHIPEDRLSTGVSAESSITDNLIAGKQKRKEFSSGGFVRKVSSVTRYAEKIFKEFDIRAADVSTEVKSLSGGNIQKTVVAREFSFEKSKVFIVCQPTRGVDIGAIEYIHSLIIKKRDEGCAILLISADLDELMRVSDRMITIFEGRITGEFVTVSAKASEVGLHMTKATEHEVSDVE